MITNRTTSRKPEMHFTIFHFWKQTILLVRCKSCVAKAGRPENPASVRRPRALKHRIFLTFFFLFLSRKKEKGMYSLITKKIHLCIIKGFCTALTAARPRKHNSAVFYPHKASLLSKDKMRRFMWLLIDCFKETRNAFYNLSSLKANNPSRSLQKVA